MAAAPWCLRHRHTGAPEHPRNLVVLSAEDLVHANQDERAVTHVGVITYRSAHQATRTIHSTQAQVFKSRGAVSFSTLARCVWRDDICDHFGRTKPLPDRCWSLAHSCWAAMARVTSWPPRVRMAAAGFKEI